MITNTEVIAQDQLRPSAALGKVRVQYQRGHPSVLSISDTGHVDTRPDSTDGPWEQATVLPNGHLCYQSDTPTAVATIVLGASLKAL